MINFLRALCVIFFAAAIGGNAFADSHLPPLHQAAADGNIAEVKRLIDGGADVNAKDNEGFTPLHYAKELAQKKTAIVLVKAGADADLPPLIQAAMGGNIAEVNRLLDGGADVDEKSEKGHTPLHWAALFGLTETALAFVKAGADIDAKDYIDRTPLHMAVYHGQTETVRALAKAGADIDAKDRFSNTPLHNAAYEGQTETVRALIEAGADINAKESNGLTPLFVAIIEGQTETVRVLVNAGADINSTALMAAIQEDSEIARLLLESIWQKAKRLFGD